MLVEYFWFWFILCAKISSDLEHLRFWFIVCANHFRSQNQNLQSSLELGWQIQKASTIVSMVAGQFCMLVEYFGFWFILCANFVDATRKQMRLFPHLNLVKVLKICRNLWSGWFAYMHDCRQWVVLQSLFFKCSKMHMKCLDAAHWILIPPSLFN